VAEVLTGHERLVKAPLRKMRDDGAKGAGKAGRQR
jgi:hypothetical protein